MRLADCFADLETRLGKFKSELTAIQRSNLNLGLMLKTTNTVINELKIIINMEEAYKPGTQLSWFQKTALKASLIPVGVRILNPITKLLKACDEFDEQDENVKTLISNVILPFLKKASNSEPAVLEQLDSETVAKKRDELRALVEKLNDKAEVIAVERVAATGGAAAAAAATGGGAAEDMFDADPERRPSPAGSDASESTVVSHKTTASDPKQPGSVFSDDESDGDEEVVAVTIEVEDFSEVLAFSAEVSQAEVARIQREFMSKTPTEQRALATYSQQDSLPIGRSIGFADKRQVIDLLHTLKRLHHFVESFDIDKFKADIDAKLVGATAEQKIFFLDYMRAYADTDAFGAIYPVLEHLKMFAQLSQEVSRLAGSFLRGEYEDFSAADAHEIMAKLESNHDSLIAVQGWVRDHSLAECPLVKQLEAYRAELVAELGFDQAETSDRTLFYSATTALQSMLGVGPAVPKYVGRVTPSDFAKAASAEVVAYYKGFEYAAARSAASRVSACRASLFGSSVPAKGATAEVVSDHAAPLCECVEDAIERHLSY